LEALIPGVLLKEQDGAIVNLTTASPILKATSEFRRVFGRSPREVWPVSFVDPPLTSHPPVLRETEVPADPLILFRSWWDRAQAARLPQPEAMTLATATRDGVPSARMVLLRGFDKRGFVFFTNYESRKGLDLVANPHAALVFYWPELDRQVRVEGRAELVSPEESDAYFASRARGSCLGAWASPQSQVLAGRDVLQGRMDEMVARFQNQPVPRPPHWGGIRVVPAVIEFWQGQPDRLHDRLRYRLLETDSWALERLAP
jgi:pyridoxamine 5'-phosphate oxidase